MTSVSAGHIIQTPTQPVGSGRPQRESNPGPPHQESRALPQSYRAPLPNVEDGASIINMPNPKVSLMGTFLTKNFLISTLNFIFRKEMVLIKGLYQKQLKAGMGTRKEKKNQK